MSSEAEIQKILVAFLLTEYGRKDHRQLVSVDLIFSPGRMRPDEVMRTWICSDEPSLFTEPSNIEGLVQHILEITRAETEGMPAGWHRFVVRCKQLNGIRLVKSFMLESQGLREQEALRKIIREELSRVHCACAR